jgi:hypothetical protein
MRELGIGVPVEAQDEMRSMTFEMAFGFEAGQGRAGQVSRRAQKWDFKRFDM